MAKTYKRGIIKKKVKPQAKDKGSKPNIRIHLLKEAEEQYAAS